MSYSRSRHRGSYYDSTITGYSEVSGSRTPINLTYANRQGSIEEMWDIVTPGFKRRSLNGEIFNNQCYIGKEKRIPSHASIVMWNPGTATKFVYNGDYLAAIYPSYTMTVGWTINTDGIVAEAITKAHAGVTQGNAALAVTIAERRKTLSMIETRVTQLRDIARAIRNRDSKSLLRLTGTGAGNKRFAKRMQNKTVKTSQLWLEYRYGWTPLVMDVNGLIKALQSGKYPRYTSRGYAAKSASTKNDWTESSWGNGNGGQPWSMSDATTESVSARAYVLYTISDEFLKANRLGLADPLGSAWELVPWSFVVDWFVNVGDWLQSITPKVGVSVLASGCTLTKEYLGTRTLVEALNYGPFEISGMNGLNQSVYGLNKSRTTNPSIPSLPTFTVHLNTKRAVDAIALAITSFKRVS